MDSDKKGHIVINYCGGWGYRSKANFVKEAVENKFPGAFTFDLKSDSGKTSRLEVTVYVGDDTEGKLVHSKDKGDGFVTDKNVDSVLESIEALL